MPPIVQLDAMFAALATLPPDANRYTFVADFLVRSVAYPMPKTVWPVVYCIVASMIIIVVLAVAGIACRIASRSFTLFHIQHGLIMPQAGLVFAINVAIFSALTAICLVIQVNCARNLQPLPPLLIFAQGAIWIVSLLAVGPWIWSIAAVSIEGGKNRGSPSVSNDAYRVKARFLNTFALAIPFLTIPPILVMFSLAAHQASLSIFHLNTCITSLRTAAQSYKFATFKTSDVVALLTPLNSAKLATEQLELYYRYGFGLWAAYDGLILAALAPFALRHFQQLGELSKRTSPSRTTSTAANTTSQAAQKGSNDILVVNSVRGTMQRRVTEYRLVFATSICVYIIGFTETALALVVATNPDFLTTPVILTLSSLASHGIYALLVPFICGVFLYRSIPGLLHHQSQPSPSRLTHSSPLHSLATSKATLRACSLTQSHHDRNNHARRAGKTPLQIRLQRIQTTRVEISTEEEGVDDLHQTKSFASLSTNSTTPTIPGPTTPKPVYLPQGSLQQVYPWSNTEPPLPVTQSALPTSAFGK